ncbi:DNA primase [Pelistega europaea]|uniref:DNA primase n=1 Tax=Pelistega europaea TaxID=106147 RepID=A0A7Y4L9V8_9BURK|nr:DNA primase [Pelistega europaea]NOL49599.1 DNA primase [Pelistega europaea]
MIPESFIQDVLNRVNVEDVVGQYVQLKKSGTNLFGLCPFHNEKTPSFSVSPQKQFFHCFSCGQSGTAIDFLMKHLGMTFPEAVKTLASRVGLQVPERQRSAQEVAYEKAQKTKSDALHECLERAQHFYQKQLRNAPVAIDYLKSRGLDGKTALKFGLGWTGYERQALKQVFENYDDPNLVDAGLVIESEDLRKYDRFRERITFPIYNARGKIIGFGGRIIGSGHPKYLNSPETAIFHKGSELYGLFENRTGIHREGFVLVVEGYMDVVGLAQLGLENAVATLGTATSSEHITKLMRITHKIVFSFDGDLAGRRAAWKALNICLPLLRDDVSMRFLFLPEEHDPDTYVREFGQDAFREQVQQSLPLSTFLIEELKENYALQEAEGRAACLHEIRAMLVQIPTNTMIRLQIEKDIAKLLSLTHEELKQNLANFIESQQHSQEARHSIATRGAVLSVPTAHRVSKAPVVEKTVVRPNKPWFSQRNQALAATRVVDPLAVKIIRLLINHPDVLSSVTERQLEMLNKHPHYELVAQFLAICMAKGTAVLGLIQPYLAENEEVQRVVMSVEKDSLHDEELSNPQAEWLGMMNKVEIELLKQAMKELSESPRDEASDQRYRQLYMRLKNLMKANN